MATPAGTPGDGPSAWRTRRWSEGRRPRSGAATTRPRPPGVWRLARDGNKLAFDHDAILAAALEWLASGVRAGRLGLALLPRDFDEAEARGMFRAVFNAPSGASQWLRRMERTGLIEPREGPGRLFRAVEAGGAT